MTRRIRNLSIGFTAYGLFLLSVTTLISVTFAIVSALTMAKVTLISVVTLSKNSPYAVKPMDKFRMRRVISSLLFYPYLRVSPGLIPNFP